MAETTYQPIYSCNVCRNVPQKSHSYTKNESGFAEYSFQFHPLSAQYKKCNHCGTYYYISSSSENPDLHILLRITPYTALSLFSSENKAPVVQLELNELRSRYPDLMADFINQLENKTSHGWHIKKYIVESVTDHLIAEDNWNSVRQVLLRNQDGVVRTEAALDLLTIGSETSCDWTNRYFDNTTKQICSQWLAGPGVEKPLEICKSLATSTTDSSDCLYSFQESGYEKTTVGQIACKALHKAIVQKINIGSIIPYLLTKVVDTLPEERVELIEFFKEYISSSERFAGQVMDAILLLHPSLTSQHDIAFLKEECIAKLEE